MEPVKEGFSAGEARFEMWRRQVGLFLGPALAVAAYLSSGGLTEAERRLAAVLALVLVYWVTEAIPLAATALLGPALCVLLGLKDAQGAFRPFAHPVIFVYLGGFMIARAMTASGLDRRFAMAVLRAPGVGRSPERVRLALGLATLLVSMWISNTATAAIFLPIAIGLAEFMDRLPPAPGGEGRAKPTSFMAGLMLMVAYAASIGGLATPVGTPPNLIGIAMLKEHAGKSIRFFDWMALGVPVSLVMFVILAVLLRVLHPAPWGREAQLGAALSDLTRDAPRWDRAQGITLLAFLTAVALWLLPGLTALIRGPEDPLYKLVESRLQEGAVSVLAASLLFIIPVGLRPPRGVLRWREAAEIDWGTILLFGGGLSLSELMAETGLAGRLVQAMGPGESAGLWTITALSTLFAVLITEFTSNVAAASMVVPLAITMARKAGVSPIPPALGATIAASLAFMLPISTPPNAILYGTGRIPILAMVKTGIWLDVLCVAGLLALLALLSGPLGLR